MSDEKKYIYLDSAATASSEKFQILDNFANPNSVHDAGRDSFNVLEGSRETIAQLIGAKRPSEIIFTSGATEANNMAIFGISRAFADLRNLRSKKSSKKPRVIVSAIEHESVIVPAKELMHEGFDVKFAPVDKHGFIKEQMFENLLTEETVLVSIQASNTEIGSIQNLKPLIDKTHVAGALFHSDFVGSLGRTSFDVSELGLDAASFSGHKIGTPKGIGFLFLKSKTPFKPLIFGSGQEGGLRGGTQNVALAASLKHALEFSFKNLDAQVLQFNLFKYKIINSVQGLDGVRITVDDKSERFLPNILHLVFKKFTSETLILKYGEFGIEVSGGPACSSESNEPSHVLKAISVDKSEINGAVRLSFSEFNNEKEIDAFLHATKQILG